MRFFGPEHDYLIVNEHPRDDFPPRSEKVKVHFLDSEKPAGISGNVEDISYLEGIEDCDKIIYSVTSYWNLKKAFGDDKRFWDKTTTALELFFENCATKNIIGVTGTKGKGTTSTLIHLMLQAAGLKTHLAGNIGTSVLDFVKDIQPSDWVVLELSSFQLFYFPYSPHISLCLRIVPEHLDWHPNLEDYIEAKANIFRHQKADDIAIYFAGNRYSQQIAGYSKGKKIPYFAPPGAVAKDEGVIVIGEEETEVIKTADIKLIGEHNLENICAALTAYYQISQNLETARQVLRSFPGLPHRLEFVRELDGVKYYDDSFGTVPQTAIVAMETFVQPKVMIVGGYDRGIPMDPLVEAILKQRVRHIIAVGQTGPKVAKMLEAKGFKNITVGLKNMGDIVRVAKDKAQSGDVVLLSAAATSFDMFKNFVERGEKFKEAVQTL